MKEDRSDSGGDVKPCGDKSITVWKWKINKNTDTELFPDSLFEEWKVVKIHHLIF